MGGRGSGLYYRWSKKGTVEGHQRLDVMALHRERRLQPGAHIELVRRSRRLVDGRRDVKEIVHLAWTECNFGGKRPWFLCPGCGRRVGALITDGSLFRCRHCYGLVYRSQQQCRAFRLLNKAQKIRERLGASLCMADPIRQKPKGMHWKTFQHLVEQEAKFAQIACVDLLARLKK